MRIENRYNKGVTKPIKARIYTPISIKKGRKNPVKYI